MQALSPIDQPGAGGLLEKRRSTPAEAGRRTPAAWPAVAMARVIALPRGERSAADRIPSVRDRRSQCPAMCTRNWCFAAGTRRQRLAPSVPLPPPRATAPRSCVSLFAGPSTSCIRKNGSPATTRLHRIAGELDVPAAAAPSPRSAFSIRRSRNSALVNARGCDGIGREQHHSGGVANRFRAQWRQTRGFRCGGSGAPAGFRGHGHRWA
jgi:hypothetical protein